MQDMAQDRAQRFAHALQRFEQDGDVDVFVNDVFDEDVQLFRPQQQQALQGRDGAREFWRQYRTQFKHVHSEFTRVVEASDMGVLEWRSRGSRPSGEPVEYAGVSLLDLDAQGRVLRFATYFDTAAFVPGVRAETS